MKNDSHETRIALLEQTVSNINTTLIRLEKKMDEGFVRLDRKMDEGFIRLDRKMDDGFIRLDKKIEDGLNRLEKKMDEGFSIMNTRIDKIDNRLWQLLFLIPASVIGILIAKIFHWL